MSILMTHYLGTDAFSMSAMLEITIPDHFGQVEIFVDYPFLLP